jgi:hypothetical protein
LPSEDIKELLLTGIKCRFALQIEEPADVQVYLSYVHLSDTALRKRTWRLHVLSIAHRNDTGSDMFKAVNDHIPSQNISWSYCFGICMDGAAALTGHMKDFQADARQFCPHLNFIHSTIRREALASRDLQLLLNAV